jgi:hypothetical protein
LYKKWFKADVQSNVLLIDLLLKETRDACCSGPTIDEEVEHAVRRYKLVGLLKWNRLELRLTEFIPGKHFHGLLEQSECGVSFVIGKRCCRDSRHGEQCNHGLAPLTHCEVSPSACISLQALMEYASLRRWKEANVFMTLAVPVIDLLLHQSCERKETSVRISEKFVDLIVLPSCQVLKSLVVVCICDIKVVSVIEDRHQSDACFDVVGVVCFIPHEIERVRRVSAKVVDNSHVRKKCGICVETSAISAVCYVTDVHCRGLCEERQLKVHDTHLFCKGNRSDCAYVANLVRAIFLLVAGNLCLIKPQPQQVSLLLGL